MSEGLLVVLSGPSGAGKGTLRPGLLAAFPNLRFCISATTRPPRRNETHGQSYLFWTRQQFERVRDAGGLLEWAEYVGNLYGTPREPVEQLLAEGRDVLLEKEMQGAGQLKEAFPQGVFIFVLPPSVAELKRRIAGRDTESPAEQLRRLQKATAELESLPDYHYDYIVVNDRLEDALDRIRAIIIAEHCRISRQASGWVDAFCRRSEAT